MYERHWGLIATGIVGLLIAVAIGWAAGRATAPDNAAQAQAAKTASGAIRLIDGIPIGVQQSRAGALAAADNYVAVTTETAVQDPARYAKLVRETYVAAYQAQAIKEAQIARTRQPELIAQYEAGRRGLALIAARRLDDYTEGNARVTTWTAGINWGPGRAAGQRWFLAETRLRWESDRWRVVKIDESKRSAPTPGVVRYSESTALTREVFERELDGMTAPSYGTEMP